jgi:hypothetical protein
MEITGIETIPVSLPVGFFEDGVDKVGGVDAPSKYYTGQPLVRRRKRDADGHILLDYVIVKILTDEGITGIGEAPCDTKEPQEAVKFIIDRHMRPHLLGLDPFDIERCMDLIRWRTSRGANRFSASAIDLALYDIVGKALNAPISTILRGAQRDPRQNGRAQPGVLRAGDPGHKGKGRVVPRKRRPGFEGDPWRPGG